MCPPTHPLTHRELVQSIKEGNVRHKRCPGCRGQGREKEEEEKEKKEKRGASRGTGEGGLVSNVVSEFREL